MGTLDMAARTPLMGTLDIAARTPLMGTLDMAARTPLMGRLTWQRDFHSNAMKSDSFLLLFAVSFLGCANGERLEFTGNHSFRINYWQSMHVCVGLI